MTMNNNTLKMETADYSETSVLSYQTAMLHTTDGRNLNIRRLGSVESQQQIKFVNFFYTVSTTIFSYFPAFELEEIV
jgi:hypothetical protein